MVEEKVVICEHCGVEVDSKHEYCPLCDNSLDPNVEKHNIYDRIRTPDKEIHEPENDKRASNQFPDFWELASALLIVVGLSVIFTDLLVSGTISWSRFVLVGLTFIWVMASLPQIIQQKPLAVGIAELVTIISFLAILDFFDDWSMSWFLNLALPIFLWSVISVAIVVYIISSIETTTINISVAVLFGISILVTGFDLSINRFISGQMSLTWSSFVIIPVLLFATFLLYVRYRFKTDEEWRIAIIEKLQI